MAIPVIINSAITALLGRAWIIGLVVVSTSPLSEHTARRVLAGPYAAV